MSAWARRVISSRRLFPSVCLAAALSAAAAGAQAPPPPQAEPGSELSVWVVTLGQGDQVWERYGHNALWIQDAARGTNRTYNWGVFDASDPRFIVRFVRGRMRYWMESVEIERVFEFYRSADRAITIQRLALSPAQRAAVRDFAEWNAREENKYYWYDYFRDNCSTRLRDAIDRALGGALRAATERQLTSSTYRSESVRLMEGMPWTQAGIAVGLGPLADRQLSAWEEMFVPMRMRDRLREVRIFAPDGARIPLVAEERQVYVARRPLEPQQPPPLTVRYLKIGASAAVAILGLGWLASAAWGAPFALVAALWGVLAGVGGLLLLFLWLGTHHLFAYRNENLFHLSPVAVALAVLAPLAIYRPRLRVTAWRVAAAVVLLSLIGVMLKAIPGFDQDNVPVVALALPGHAALAWVLMRLARAAEERAVAAPGEAPTASRQPSTRRAPAS